MPPSDGPDVRATTEESSAAQPGAPIVRAPLAQQTRFTVLDGHGEPEPQESPRAIEPGTATAIGDLAAAMAGPLAAALISGSVAVFAGAALLVLMLRSQGRRSALTDREIGTLSPATATLGAAVFTLAVGGGFELAWQSAVGALLCGIVALLIVRQVMARLVHTRIAVLGDARDAHELAWQLSRDGHQRFSVVGYVTRSSQRDDLRELTHISFRLRRLGLLADLSQIVAREDVDLLVLAETTDRLKYFERAAACGERFSTRLITRAAFEEHVFRRVPLEQLNVAWFQHVLHPRFRPVSHAFTRVLDVVVAVGCGLLTLPLWAPAALLVRRRFGRPVLHFERRIGLRGRTIALCSFAVNDFDAFDNEPQGRLGRLLRRSGIERLPRLINLFHGDITLVGPRSLEPESFAELKEQIPFWGRRQMLRPGLTGWAQLQNPADPETELSLDLFYLKHQSLMLHAHILLRSCLRRPAALGRQG